MTAVDRDRRVGIAAVAALLGHALVLAIAASLPGRGGDWQRSLAHADSAPQLEIEITIDAAPPTSDSEPLEVAAATPDRRAPVAARAAEPAPAIESAPALEPAPEPALEPAPPSTSEPGPRRLTLAELGIGQPPPVRLVDPERPATRRRALAKRVDQMLSAGLAQRDFERGRGAHGAVVSALEQAAFSARTPERGSALFVARIERGRVAIHVLEATRDLASWREAAERAMRALRGKKLRLPAGARGVEVTIRVTSNVELPSGADPGLEVRALGIPLQKGEGKKSARLEILSPRLDVGTTKVPNPGGGDPIELPTVELGLDVLALLGDPADIGATPRRMVHARVEKQTIVPEDGDAVTRTSR
jgi:hypothetical protein